MRTVLRWQLDSPAAVEAEIREARAAAERRAAEGEAR
jgi:hypothetical protein